MKRLLLLLPLLTSECSMLSMETETVPQKKAQLLFEHYLVPSEVVGTIVNFHQKKESSCHSPAHYLPKKEYSYCLNKPLIYPYYWDYPPEQLYEPTTLNTLELIGVPHPTPAHRDRLHGKDLLAGLHDIETMFRLQLWAWDNFQDIHGRIRIDEDIEAQANTTFVKERFINNHLMFDGTNNKHVCALGIQNPTNFRLLMYNIYNGDSNNGKKVCDQFQKAPLEKKEYTNQTLKSLMLHYYKNRIVMCTQDLTTQQNHFLIEDIIQNKTTLFNFKTWVNQPLHFGLKHIGRLTDKLYLGLSDHGTVVTIARRAYGKIEVNEKKIMYTIMDNDKEIKVEDTFTHLAVDNCTDSYGNHSIPHHATRFLLLNKDGILFWCSGKKPFYNAEDKITIRKMSHQNFSSTKKLWLKDNEIGILMPATADQQKDPSQKLVVVKHAIEFFQLPTIEDKASSTT